MRLAQGQRAAEMTLARPTGSAESSAEAPSEAAEEGQAAEVDPQAVAERVYQLMRQDLRTTLERRG